MNFKIADIGFKGGKKFSPLTLSNKLGIELNIVSDPNVASKIGKYKGQLPPFGLAYYRVDLSKIEETLSGILKSKAILSEGGVEEIIVHLFLDEYSTHINNKVVHLISELNATIELHYSNSELQAA